MSKPTPRAKTSNPKLGKSGEKALRTVMKLKQLSEYDPYKIFDSRKGCMVAVGGGIALIVITTLNAFLNGNWISLVFIPFYFLIIRNRLRRLRTME
jgi:hypothetical protein